MLNSFTNSLNPQIFQCSRVFNIDFDLSLGSGTVGTSIGWGVPTTGKHFIGLQSNVVELWRETLKATGLILVFENAGLENPDFFAPNPAVFKTSLICQLSS